MAVTQLLKHGKNLRGRFIERPRKRIHARIKWNILLF